MEIFHWNFPSTCSGSQGYSRQILQRSHFGFKMKPAEDEGASEWRFIPASVDQSVRRSHSNDVTLESVRQIHHRDL